MNRVAYSCRIVLALTGCLALGVGCEPSPRPPKPKPTQATPRPADQRADADITDPAPTKVAQAGKPPNPLGADRVKTLAKPPETKATPDSRVRSQLFPDGSRKREWEEKMATDGSWIKHGLWRAWHANGEPYLETHYVDGQRHGLMFSWHKNGQMRGRSEYDHGKDTGTFIYWDESGQERKEYESVDGLKHGRYTEWDENGEIFETGEYLRGRKHGAWLKREADGRVVETHWVQGRQQAATTRP